MRRNRIAAIESVTLKGLALATPQVLGGVRLVPLLREHPSEDLRLGLREYGDDLTSVQIDRRTSYHAFVPHALVADWTQDGSPVSQAAFGGQISQNKSLPTMDGKSLDFGFATVRFLSRVRKREGKNQLRFLPSHVAMEGFLSLYFGGPSIAWEEYSRSALRSGLSPRIETSFSGDMIRGLEDALRLFEIHPNQVGLLIFVGEELASAFVVPHPNDYLRLHRTLLVDFFGELIYYRGLHGQEVCVFPEPMNGSCVSDFAGLRNELVNLRRRWSDVHTLMSSRLFNCDMESKTVYRMGPFQMQRFITDLDPKGENHIGERILRLDGTLEYLKTYRLSATQCRRAYLLKKLAESDWELEVCAATLDCTKYQLVSRLEDAGFGYLLHQHVLDAARKSRG